LRLVLSDGPPSEWLPPPHMRITTDAFSENLWSLVLFRLPDDRHGPKVQ
jgi:hypothetical protein